MATSILATKLYIPPPPSRVILRLRLTERLNEGVQRKLTLISAPAGFGKTTMVSDWVATAGRKVAWLSLDEGDSDPARFLTYLVAALRTVAPNIGEGVLSVLQSPQIPPIEALLTDLLNEIIAFTGDLVIVLDDYHMVDARPVDEALTFLLEHMPPHVHLVITTREDPQLPLPRLRARGQLTEVRAADLRFTPSEAADFLNQALGLNFSEEDISILESRTEGWIAGLQLAALSMRGHQDVPAFIRSFAGDHRYIVDYLVEEVLQRQSESIRTFLLHTSILDRLCGPLCDAVTGQHGGNMRLEALERGNFFVVPLDNKRYWYRYHHLFGEVLYAHLLAEHHDEVTILHLRASEWYEQNGSPSDAIRHALAAHDFERAASLVELAAPALFRSRQEAGMLAWFKVLPDELFRRRPVLSIAYVGVLMGMGRPEGVDALLRNAEWWLNALNSKGLEAPSAGKYELDEMVVVDQEEFRRLPGAIAMYRAGLAQARGDVAGTMKYARMVLDLALEDDYFYRGAATAFLGLAYWASGDLEAAYRTYSEGMASVQRAGFISDANGSAIFLADIRIAQGRLHDAMGLYERGLQLTSRPAGTATGSVNSEAGQSKPIERGTADIYVGMSAIHIERNNLDAAIQHLLRSKELERTGVVWLPQKAYRWCIVMARLREAEGNLDGALEYLDEAERLYASDFSPDVCPISALRARVWIAQGKLDEAVRWVQERGLSAQDDLSYLREFEHITLARLLMAQYRSKKSNGADYPIEETMRLLDRLLKAAEEGDRTRSVIEILVLQALAHQAQAQAKTHAALVPLKRALTLAEPEGYVRIFVGEGMQMVQLLREVAKQGITSNYLHHLLAAFGAPGETGAAEERTPIRQPLVEPLSERELDVLRLLRTELSGPEIAGELMVSLSTMRTHTRNIYDKLGVDNRRAAVRRAEELHLL